MVDTPVIHSNGHKEGDKPSFLSPAVTELILSNELKVWVYEINQADFRALLETFQKDSPPPNKKDFERPVPAEDASYEGQMFSGESNPEYLQAMADYNAKYRDFIVFSYLIGYVEFPDFSETELIERYAKPVARKRKVMTLPEDPWKATVLHALITEKADRQLIVNAIEKRLAVEMGEVTAAVRIFRPVDSGHTNGKVSDRGSEARSTEAEAGIQRD